LKAVKESSQFLDFCKYYLSFHDPIEESGLSLFELFSDYS
jgi:hypothetical protein